MIRRARRQHRSGATEEEWLWLTASPGHNEFLGFNRALEGRMAALWAEHEAEIRRLWDSTPPAELPFGHPAAT